MLPYLGLNFPVGEGSDGLSTGFRLGGLFGFHVGSLVSLNGELSIDVLNPDTDGGADVSTGLVGFTFSPLFHFGPPNLDIVVGPRLGYFGSFTTIGSSGSSREEKYSSTGLAYGFNAGAFFWLGRMAVGGLLSFTFHSPSEACYSGYDTNYREVCGDASGGTDSKLLTLNGALLF